MKISEEFIGKILSEAYPEDYQEIFDKSLLLQYLDKKTGAVHGNSKTRRSLGSIYAVYSLLHFYSLDFYNNPSEYRRFEGYEFTHLLDFCRTLYGGSKLQNHALNNRVNFEFRNKVNDSANAPIISNGSKYLLHIDYLYTDGRDISRTCCKIIEKYISLLKEKDSSLLAVLQDMKNLKDYGQKKQGIKDLLSENAEARVFEIISYAVLKNHYKNIKIYFGYTKETINEEALQLFKTGRTNANDGGIDFVMRPLGRFFQVTEVNSNEH